MAEMRPAEEMKDSGIEYIGEIPVKWSTIKLCYVTDRIFLGKTPQYAESENANLTLGQKNNQLYGIELKDVKYSTDEHYNSSKDEDFLAFGDILLNSLGTGSVGRIGYFNITNQRFLTDGHIIVIRPSNSIQNKYLFYYLRTLRAKFEDDAVGSTNQAFLTVPKIYKTILPYPSYSEQQAIADYLDDRCSKIDEIIAEATASIEEYKELKQAVITEAVTKGLDKSVPMKDSGIEWLPYVPEHWDVRRIATIYDESKETGRDDLPILLVSIHTGISDREIDNEERDRKVIRSEDKTIYKVVHKNYLAYNMMRAWQGGFGAAAIDGLVSPAYVVAKQKIEVNSAYIENVLRTPNAIEHIRGMSYGVADFRLRLYWPYFKNIRVPFPSIEEQNRIVEYIKNHALKFDSLISEKQSLISDLQAYKKSLIYEVVTGKRRVV